MRDEIGRTAAGLSQVGGVNDTSAPAAASSAVTALQVRRGPAGQHHVAAWRAISAAIPAELAGCRGRQNWAW